MKLKVTITKTADGRMDYVQIMSDDTLSVNVVLMAEAIELLDGRAPKVDAMIRKRGDHKDI